MPLYEYECSNCKKRFEVIQKFADPPLTSHEECGGGPVERLVSVSALQFKGSGWYVNDYAKGNNGSKAESADKADKKESKTDSKSTSESASAAKSEAPAPKPAAPASGGPGE